MEQLPICPWMDGSRAMQEQLPICPWMDGSRAMQEQLPICPWMDGSRAMQEQLPRSNYRETGHFNHKMTIHDLIRGSLAEIDWFDI